MKSEFQNILEDFSAHTGLSIKIEGTRCVLLFNEELEVHFVLDVEKKSILIATFICPLPPGKFREEILLHGLQANQVYYPQLGTFAYSDKANQLCFFRYSPMEGLNGEKLSDDLAIFLETSFEWKKSIEQNNAAPVIDFTQKMKPI